MLKRLSSILFLLVLGASLPEVRPAYADTVKDVYMSKEMEAFEWKGRNRDLDVLTGLTPNSNLARIFTQGAKVMVDWVEAYTPGFTRKDTDAWAGREFAWAWKKFQGGADNSIFTVTVVLPHPRYLKNLDIGLMPELTKFEPPALKVESSEPIDIKGSPGTLYFRRDGTCSILMKITKRAIVNVEGPSCRRVDEIIKLTEMLDIRRLQEKLDS
jgi:hypothetical protein